MKKTMVYILALSMLLSLCACGGRKDDNKVEPSVAPQVTTQPGDAVIPGENDLMEDGKDIMEDMEQGAEDMMPDVEDGVIQDGNGTAADKNGDKGAADSADPSAAAKARRSR